MAPRNQSAFSEPLTIRPLSLPHRQTFILLHGRGSSASKFGPVFLNTPFTVQPANTRDSVDDSPLTTLAKAFPHAKFVFPTSPRSRATIYKRSIINQWFDSWHLDLDDDDDDDDDDNNNAARATTRAQGKDWYMIEGLQQTTEYLHALLRREIALVPGGAGSVVLGGFSQGCAASLVALLLWDGEPLAALLGMCGWLPFTASLMEVVRCSGSTAGAGIGSDGDEVLWADEFDPFDRSGDDGVDRMPTALQPRDVSAAVVRELQERLELDGQSVGHLSHPVSLNTRVFLGHGSEDDKVPLQLARTSAECLQAIGINVSWNAFPGLHHWYSSDMLTSIARFLESECC